MPDRKGGKRSYTCGEQLRVHLWLRFFLDLTQNQAEEAPVGRKSKKAQSQKCLRVLSFVSGDMDLLEMDVSLVKPLTA